MRFRECTVPGITESGSVSPGSKMTFRETPAQREAAQALQQRGISLRISMNISYRRKKARERRSPVLQTGGLKQTAAERVQAERNKPAAADVKGGGRFPPYAAGLRCLHDK